MFDIKDKSTFSYWFAHWCAYQMTALNLKCWKFKYLFHDIEKPWLKLFFPYEKVKKIHRINSKHHLEYKNRDKIDWYALIIDWECSHFTKIASKWTSREIMEHKMKNRPELKELLEKNMMPILNKLKL